MNNVQFVRKNMLEKHQYFRSKFINETFLLDRVDNGS